MKTLNGIGVSDGFAVAKAFVFKKTKSTVSNTVPKDIEKEKAALEEAYARLTEHLEALAEKDSPANEIFEAHLVILYDPTLLASIRQKIEAGSNAAWAVKEVMTELAEEFFALDDEYMRARGEDIVDLRDQLLSLLTGEEKQSLDHLPGRVILVASDLTPSDTMSMDAENIAAIVCENGSATSHVSIIAKNMFIPAVVAAKGITEAVTEDMEIAVDGKTGTVILVPDADTREAMLKKQADYGEKLKALKEYRTKDTVTRDGVHLSVEANIGGVADAEKAVANGADRVGLFRTEFLYMENEQLPDEETQFLAYKTVAETFRGNPVIIRTLDIGGDKKLPSLPIPEEENPFLGYRAIRICLQNRPLFRTQIRALLRAGVYGNIKIMLPMITCLEELRAAKEEIEAAKSELRTEKAVFNEQIPVGIMVETPAAVMMAEELAKEADFFSIGTNDLLQYTMCADRGNAAVSYLYSPFKPAVLRMIREAIRAAHANGIRCGMCGEAASNPLLIPLLAGWGLDEFSVNIGSVLATKEKICALDTESCKKLALRVDTLKTEDEVRNELSAFR